MSAIRSSDHPTIQPSAVHGVAFAVLTGAIGRSGSSVGANYAESGAAESQKDFVHKLSIALKEAEETNFWLGCLSRECPQFPEADALIKENREFIQILQKSISTAKRNLPNP